MHGGVQDTRSRYPTAVTLLNDQAALPVQAETLAFQYVVPPRRKKPLCTVSRMTRFIYSGLIQARILTRVRVSAQASDVPDLSLYILSMLEPLSVTPASAADGALCRSLPTAGIPLRGHLLSFQSGTSLGCSFPPSGHVLAVLQGGPSSAAQLNVIEFRQASFLCSRTGRERLDHLAHRDRPTPCWCTV
jgi:hypothetical protein